MECEHSVRGGKKTGKMGSSLLGNFVIWKENMEKYSVASKTAQLNLTTSLLTTQGSMLKLPNFAYHLHYQTCQL